MPLTCLLLFDQEIADVAAKLVDVEYTDIRPPVLSIEDAISANSFYDVRGADWQAGNANPCFQS